MAAESNSMSLAADRHMYIRILLDILWTGNTEVNENWRTNLRHRGGLVTDARSLFDHIHTTGHIPSERQTMLDLLVAKSLVEQKAFEVFWVPTFKQFADMLTKRMRCTLWEQFCQESTVSLKETEAERKYEEHRQRLRKEQRQRRKKRFGSANEKTGCASNKYRTGSAR